MLDIATLLQQRIEASQNGTLKEQFQQDSKTYSKNWAKAVKHFQDRINLDRKKEKKPPTTFIVIRQKLAHIKEIDDLRYFYKMCVDYKYKKKGNTFSKCFFGALKIK